MDRKRIALFDGNCTASSRIEIRGQILDAPLLPGELQEDWDPYLCLSQSGKTRIRPLHDLRLHRVRKPVLQLEIIDSPGRTCDPEQLARARILHRSPRIHANRDGTFLYRMNESLAPGHYSVRAIPVGLRSLRQMVRDRRTRPRQARGEPVGYGKLRVLPDDYRGWIITSDVDQTFLDTDIETRQGLIGTLFETPDKKLPLPGMAAFYRELRKEREDPLPLLFLSASPHFFRRTFQALFQLHDIDYTALSLKRFGSIIEPLLRQILSSMTKPGRLLAEGLGGILENLSAFFTTSVDGLFHQVSYKLIILLENRLRQPTEVREILMGDNTESDFLTFALYQLLLSGRLGFGEMEEILPELRFHGKRTISGVHIPIVIELARKNLKIHGRINPVEHVWINLAYDRTRPEHIMETLRHTLPGWSKESERIINRLTTCDGAVGFARAALEAGILDPLSIERIQKIVSVEEERFR